MIRLRPSEWILLGYFAYVAAIAPVVPGGSGTTLQPEIALGTALAMLAVLAALHLDRVRDWAPIPLTLLAFREMEIFLPPSFDGRLEKSWMKIDVLLLSTWHLRDAIESLGRVLPLYFEFCYLLVYGLGAFCIAVFYFTRRRKEIDAFYVTYLSGTLGAYALFPFFPSQPPRLLFPAIDAPRVITWARHLNLFILRHGTIHLGVFPSAHVSSAFAAAWAMFLLFPQRKLYGYVTLVYAISVSIATVYGRYHYAADVMAGFAVSLVAGSIGLLVRRRQSLVRDQCVEK